ncbi:MAG: FtsH protease activity modulator HflK [Myxococcota bacterium]|nr:FtsH protease activity modulator HflK [Myxococcota bacterium]
MARVLANLGLLLLLAAGIGGWFYLGGAFFTVEPGQSAVVLRFGEYVETVEQPGFHWRLPAPIERHEIVNVASVSKEEFGYPADAGEQPTEQERLQAAMQTSDNNIVHVSFVVQYRIQDAFKSRYRVADPLPLLRDAAQASVRRVVGRNTIDDVLSEKRGVVGAESGEILQRRLDGYESGLEVLGVELQDVQPPPSVRAAFDDVLAASQDRDRAVNEAEGYANEVLPQARAKALETVEGARAYRDSKIAEAAGEAQRFRAIAAEYGRAPEVVRTRLFLETMEAVLPEVHTVIMERDSSVLPFLPLDAAARREGTP